MNRNWNLRDELYDIFHRWPLLLGSLLIGCLLGWGLSFIWPSHYRATSQIYLALNPYRRFSDTLFEALANPKYSNLDNYQYWQMSQLEAAIYTDTFLQPTLDKLRLIDPYWDTVDLEELGSMLSSEWRTTGNWSLIADHPNPEYAGQAASVWSDVAVTGISQAVDAARRTFMIDQQLQAGEDESLQARLRRKDLDAAIANLQAWQNDAPNRDPNLVLDPVERWRIIALVSSPAQFSPAWTQVLEKTPSLEAPVSAYQAWIAEVIPLLRSDSADLKGRIEFLDQQQIDLAQRYAVESQASLSFSPNIEVKRKEDQGIRIIRPTSIFVLTGGLIGLLIALLIQLFMISTSWSHR
jgi:hypothetical protein